MRLARRASVDTANCPNISFSAVRWSDRNPSVVVGSLWNCGIWPKPYQIAPLHVKPPLEAPRTRSGSGRLWGSLSPTPKNPKSGHKRGDGVRARGPCPRAAGAGAGGRGSLRRGGAIPGAWALCGAMAGCRSGWVMGMWALGGGGQGSPPWAWAWWWCVGVGAGAVVVVVVVVVVSCPHPWGRAGRGGAEGAGSPSSSEAGCCRTRRRSDLAGVS